MTNPQPNQRHIDPVTGEIYENDAETGAIAVFNPGTVTLSLDSIRPEWPHEQKVKALAVFTEAITAPSVGIDDFLNSIIKVVGCFQHAVEVNDANNILVPATRTVIMVKGANGDDFEKVENVSMVSTAVAKVFSTTIIPLFGSGMWEEPVYMKFRKVPTRRGSTFSMRILEGPKTGPTGYTVSEK